MYLNYIFFVHPSVVGHLSWFYDLAIVSTAVETLVCSVFVMRTCFLGCVVCPCFLPTVVTVLNLGWFLPSPSSVYSSPLRVKDQHLQIYTRVISKFNVQGTLSRQLGGNLRLEESAAVPQPHLHMEDCLYLLTPVNLLCIL